MIFGIWLIALSITIPWAMYFQLVPMTPETPDIEICYEVWPDGASGTLYFLIANLLACYLIPMIMISICYTLIWIKVIEVLRGWSESYINLFVCQRYRVATFPAKQKTLRRIAYNSSRKSKS